MTKEKSRSRGKRPPNDEDLDAWIQSSQPTTRCHTCNKAEVAETIRRLLRAMIRNKASTITLKELHRKTKAVHKDYTTGFWGFRDHLYDCEGDLYRKAKQS